MPKFKIIANIIAVITTEPTTSLATGRLRFDKYFNFFFVFFLLFISFAQFVYLKSKRRKIRGKTTYKLTNLPPLHLVSY